MVKPKVRIMRLEGKKVFLYPWKPSDAKSLNKLVRDKDIARYTTIPFPYKPKLAKDYIERSVKKRRKNEEFHFGIFSKETKQLVGDISIIRTEWKNKKAEIGYWL